MINRDGKLLQNVYLSNGTNVNIRFIEKWHSMQKFMKSTDSVENKLIETIVWGPTDDDRDHLQPSNLPVCRPQDWLLFYMQGAYGNNLRTRLSEDTPLRSVISYSLWNQLKESSVFRSCKLLINPDITTPLQSNLPPLQPKHRIHLQPKMDAVKLNGSICRNPIYVLKDRSPDDVARSMIDGGQQQRPFYIFNMDEAFQRIQHFKHMMPRVKIFYAMKSNDTKIMLKLAVALGLGFDCASPGEIFKIRQMNIDPKSIIYAMPSKTPDQIIYARKSGVLHTTFDSSYELKKLKKYWPDARLLIRIRVDSDSKIQLGDKFGCDFETEAVNLLDEAAELGLRVVGVAFHVGCMCQSLKSYLVGIHQARLLFDHEAQAGRQMNIVDIGGGFRSDATNSIDEVSPLINKALADLFPDENIQIVAEPGRYISDSAFKLFCSISGIRRVKKNGHLVNMVYINDGVYGTMRYPEKWHKISKLQRSTEETTTAELEDTILWGPSCDSLDRVMKDFNIQLPRCEPMDWLVVENHGAYTFTFSTKFSSLELPLIRSVASVELWNILNKSAIFEESDFISNPDVTAPLPSTLPPPVPIMEVYDHLQIPTLKL